MKIAHAEEASCLLMALPRFENEQAGCLKFPGRIVVMEEIPLPSDVWGQILSEARGIVLKRLAKLGVKVEP